MNSKYLGLFLASIFVLENLFLSPLLISQPLPNEDEDILNVIAVNVMGNERTQLDAILGYLDLDHLPKKISRGDLALARLKLLSTGLFSNVIFLEIPVQEKGEPKKSSLLLEVEEKWTLIPVFRGEYGGGVPLKVIGAYNTNFLGEMLTAGAQAMQYGQEQWGGYLWFKAPYYQQGRFDLGAELSQINRLRPSDLVCCMQQINRENLVKLQENTLKTYFHWPLSSDNTIPFSLSSMRIGLDLQFLNRKILEDEDSQDTEDLDSRELVVLPGFIYDSITTVNSDHEGSKFVFKFGPVLSHPIVPYSELEYFNYVFLGHFLNLSSHLWIGQYNSTNVFHKFYLGGLDSVRGFPDAYLSGSKASYANIEARDVRFKYQHFWWQIVSFVDAGMAGNTWDEAHANAIFAIGAGVRISMPKIYRLMLRLDYAVNAKDPRVSSVSFGLNQFFQPRRPR